VKDEKLASSIPISFMRRFIASTDQYAERFLLSHTWYPLSEKIVYDLAHCNLSRVVGLPTLLFERSTRTISIASIL